MIESWDRQSLEIQLVYLLAKYAFPSKAVVLVFFKQKDTKWNTVTMSRELRTSLLSVDC